MFDISYLWDTGKINTRVTNTTNFIDRDHDGTPYILAPIQHGVRLFDKSGNDVWSYSGITQGYDVRDIAVGDLFETGFNDSCVVASGYYSTSKTFAVIDKDGNAQAFTPSTGYQCNRVLIKDTDIYLCGNTFVTKYVKDGTAWVEDLAGWAKSIGEAKDMVIADAGNGERLFVSSYGDRKVYSYLLDGTPEWASSIGAYGGNIAVGKIDTTRPGLQVVVTYQGGIRVFDKDGGILSTISSPGSNVRTGLVLYDCDADGEDEIYFTDMGNNIFCLDRSGSSYITKYSSNGAYTTSAGLINFDINKDGKDELVAGTQNGKMLILSPELEILSTIDTGLGNVVAGGFYYNYVFLSNGTRFPDIDGDGYPDLIFSVSSGAVYAYKITSASTPLEDYEGDVSIAANGIVFSLGEKSVGFSLSTAGIGGLTRQGIKSSMGSINLSGTCRVVVDGFRPIDGYIVERRIGDGEWQELAEIDSPDITTWDDDDTFEHGKVYSYRIKRVINERESDWSDIVSVTYLIEYKEGVASVSVAGRISTHGTKRILGGSAVSAFGHISIMGRAIESVIGESAVSGRGALDAVGYKGAKSSTRLTMIGSLESTGCKQASSSISISIGGKVTITGTRTEYTFGSVTISTGGTISVLGAKQTRAPPAIFGKGSVFASGVKSSHRNIFVVNTGQITHLGYKHVPSYISITSKTLIGTLGTKKSTGITAVFGSGQISIDGLMIETFFGEVIVFGRGNISAIGQKSALATPIPKLRGSTFGNGSKSTGGTATTLALGRIRTKAFCMRFGAPVASGVGWTTGWGKKGLVGTVRLFSHGVIAIEDIAAQNIYRFETSEADFNKGVLDGVRVEPDGSVRLVV